MKKEDFSECFSFIMKDRIISEKNGNGVFKSYFTDSPIIYESLEEKVLHAKRSIFDSVRIHFNDIAKAIEIMSMDQRFIPYGLNFYNKAFLLYEINKVFDFVFNVESMEQFWENISRVGFILFDLDGLKSVNEYAGYDNGDKFLFNMALLLSSASNTSNICFNGFGHYVREYCKDYHFKITSASFSMGDEFASFFLAEESISVKILSGFAEALKMDAKNVETFNFSKPEIRQKVKSQGLVIPDDFDNGGEAYKFPFSFSYGVSTLVTALDAFIENIRSDLTHKQFINDLIKIFFRIAENECKEIKNKYKTKIRSGNKEEVFLSELYLRSDTGRTVSAQNDVLLSVLSKVINNNKLVSLDISWHERNIIKGIIKEKNGSNIELVSILNQILEV